MGELEQEITHAGRSIPPATRRAMVARDHRCVFPGCDRPAPWCDGHHLVHWADAGPTKLDNLGLVCRTHHRKVHEEGWKLRREKDGRWIATPPALIVTSRSRSG
ncbi:MAG: HNH endonuclease [Chloroflexi bacterium]|nr:MAG: HNH endonuclease [Chloroflexota bacterium]